ncbi:MAG: LysM peptidoglycan-binding domain-containing protein [Candidatus Omnitrophica bacterium]|nr:LysM peptidoglycan-binding domain-containing protein [Candidatus Omnitrophota bacterium]
MCIKYPYLITMMFLCTFLYSEGVIQYHYVKKGETLSSISKRYGTTVHQLKKLNNLKSSVIQPKQKLIVKKSDASEPSKGNTLAKESKTAKENTSVKVSVPAGHYETISYTVKKGDTLEGISRRYGVSVAKIKKTNNLKTSTIKIGQTLKINVPKKEPLIPEVTTPQPIVGVSTERIYYRIKKGDTVESIASQYNITPEKLKEANLMSDGDFKEGVTIVIPSLPVVEESASIIDQDDMEKEIVKETKTLRDIVLKESFNFLNMPYRLGGSGNSSIDCSTLVRRVYEKVGIKLPNTSSQQFKEGEPVRKEEIEEGDLVFFYRKGSIGHVGIYIGDNFFIHASSNEKKVTIASLENSYFKRNFAGARRLLPSKSLFVKGEEDVISK